MNRRDFISKLDVALSSVIELKLNTRSDSIMFPYLDLANDLLMRCMKNATISRSCLTDKADPCFTEHMTNEDDSVPSTIVF